MLSKLIRSTKNWSACSWHRMGPIHLHDNVWLQVTQQMHQTLNKLSYEVLPHPPHSHELLPTDYHFFRHLNNFFAGKVLPQPARGKKCFARVCWIPKHRFLCYRRNKFIFHQKKVFIVMVSILINKDMFEPSYNDLKFTVQTCNDFFAIKYCIWVHHLNIVHFDIKDKGHNVKICC